MTIKAQEFDRIVKKLGLQTRKGKDLLAWFEHEGRMITRTRRSHGSGDLPMQRSIPKQLMLTEQQVRDVIKCKLDRDAYIDILRGKGLL
jgi:hypothetical protein